MANLRAVIENTTHLFINDIKDFYNNTTGSKLQITTCTDGQVVIEGFRQIHTAPLSDICRKYGRDFIIHINEDRHNIRITFSISSLVSKPETPLISNPPFLSAHLTSVPATLQHTQEKVASLLNGDITQCVDANNTRTLYLSASVLTSETTYAIQALPSVISITVFTDKITVVLMKNSTSQSSLAYLKQHRPELFIPCVNNKQKSNACKVTSNSNRIHKPQPLKKKAGYTRWRLW